MATKVVESTLNLFVERSLGEARKLTATMRRFIDRELASYESRLVALDEQTPTPSPRTPQNVRTEVYSAMYAQLLRKREQLRLTDKASETFGPRFNVIEPPRVPLEPIWPPRLLFYIFAGLLGVFAGLVHFISLRPRGA